MDFCADHHLGGVVAIFNCNTLGQSDYVSSAQDWEHLAAKAAAFGARTEIIDGHDPEAIERALRIEEDGRPLAIIARTVKGWGVPSLGGPGHHGTPVKAEALAGVLAELEETARHLGVTDIGAQDFAALKIEPPAAAPAAHAAPRAPLSFGAALAKNPALASAKKISPRRAYGMALAALGDANEAVVALDADVKNSTYAETFAKAHPDRYFEARIAEQNMVSAAAGLAAGGKIAFVSTFGRFLERAFDQIEMAIIGGARIKLVGTHVGVTLAADGPSQMALADVGFTRALAHAKDAKGRSLVVLTPSDAVSAYKLILAMAEYDGPAYLRAVRGDLPILYRDDNSFPMHGSKVVRRAEAPAVVLAASGYLVHSCLEAAAALEQRGIAAAVVDAYALPLDATPILEMARQARAAILAVEDNYVGGTRQRTRRGVGCTCRAGYRGKPRRATPAEERPHPRRRARICRPVGVRDRRRSGKAGAPQQHLAGAERGRRDDRQPIVFARPALLAAFTEATWGSTMGMIVSANVGLPQDVAWQGRTVRTAVWKTPVTGRIFARRLNLDGDGQGDLHGHGGEQRAIMVYQLEVLPLLGELSWAVGSSAREFRREPHS